MAANDTYPVARVSTEKSLDNLAWLMDDLIRVPVLGWRIGLDPLIGLIPGFGDTASSLVSFYILVNAVRHRVPKITLLRMGLNLGIDYVVGAIPLVGDVFDAWFKSNQRNLDLLKERATVSPEEARAASTGDWVFVGAIILPLILLAVASFFISIYLGIRVWEFIFGS